MFDVNVNILGSTGPSKLVKTSTYKAGHVASALLLVILVRSRTGKLYSGSVKVKVVAAAMIVGAIVKVIKAQGSTKIRSKLNVGDKSRLA